MTRTTLQEWEDYTEWPLMGAAVLFLIGYAWPIIDPSLAHVAKVACELVTWATWALFVLDYVVRVSLAPERRRYVVRHLLDLAVVVLPLLRPLRMLRLVALLNVVNRGAGQSLRGRVVAYVIGGASLMAFVGALAVLDAERHAAHPNITNFGTALWWALTTMTTVGYGDHYPITVQGRFAAAGLMIGGIALLGAVTATLASWLVERVAEETTSDEQLRREIAELRAEIRALADRLTSEE